MPELTEWRCPRCRMWIVVTQQLAALVRLHILDCTHPLEHR